MTGKPNLKKSESQKPDDHDFFMKVAYPEIKDLGTHFLTLISGILAFTVTFSDKITDVAGEDKFARFALFFSWIGLTSAMVFVGIGLWANYNLAVHASFHKFDAARQLLRRAYLLYLAGGFSFTAGLGLLVVSGILRLKIF